MYQKYLTVCGVIFLPHTDKCFGVSFVSTRAVCRLSFDCVAFCSSSLEINDTIIQDFHLH